MSNNRKYWFHCSAMQFFYCSIAVAGNDDHIEKKYAWKYNHKNGSTMVNTGSIARQCYFLLFNCRCWHWRAVIDSKSNLTRKIALWAMRPVFSVADLFLWLYFHAYSFLIWSSLPAPAIEQEKNCIAEQWNQYFLLLNIFLKFVSVTNHFICSRLNATLFRVKERTVMTEHDKTSI